MLAIFNAVPPMFFSVACSARLKVPTGCTAKGRLVGVRLTSGWRPPMPVSRSLCGLPAALSVMVTAPVRVPVAVGVKDLPRKLPLPPARRLDLLLHFHVFEWHTVPCQISIMLNQ